MTDDDPVLLDDWHPVAAARDVPAGTPLPVRLLARELVLWRDAAGRIAAWDDRCPHRGAPFEEHDDTRLRPVVCGPYDVQTSGPRVIENFLDMAHFGFVHEGILGSADDTAVPPCDVEDFVDESGASGVRARNCAATQPRASLQTQAMAQVRYRYTPRSSLQ
jgi:phenylpropionate dioxygenase-like ring-hydroxylating dioxygenase large terminal subunit